MFDTTKEKQWVHNDVTLTFEPPDILIQSVRGTLTLDVACFVQKVYEEVSEAGRFYLLIDASGVRGFEPDARWQIAHGSDCYKWFAGFVWYGGSFFAKAIVTLMSQGMTLARKWSIPIGITSTEKEARAWIAEQQRKRMPILFISQHQQG